MVFAHFNWFRKGNLYALIVLKNWNKGEIIFQGLVTVSSVVFQRIQSFKFSPIRRTLHSDSRHDEMTLNALTPEVIEFTVSSFVFFAAVI